MKRQVFAAGLPSARPEAGVSRAMRQVEALAHRVDRLALERLKPQKSVKIQRFQLGCRNHAESSAINPRSSRTAAFWRCRERSGIPSFLHGLDCGALLAFRLRNEQMNRPHPAPISDRRRDDNGNLAESFPHGGQSAAKTGASGCKTLAAE
ncbi:MAG: hypothetical protein ABSG83_01670 [Roseiarcus sp.]